MSSTQAKRVTSLSAWIGFAGVVALVAAAVLNKTVRQELERVIGSRIYLGL
jgi:ATP phosphoribosyltransferase regulatory subunit HisZ